jgi:hypothetical protein
MQQLQVWLEQNNININYFLYLMFDVSNIPIIILGLFGLCACGMCLFEMYRKYYKKDNYITIV